MSEIKAGRKLDALMARTLGWTHLEVVGQFAEGLPPREHYRSGCPLWSRGGNAAIRLLEEENREGANLALIPDDDGHYACVPGGHVGWPDHPDDRKHLSATFGTWIRPDAWFDNIALAIVVGILRAHGVDVEAELARKGGWL